MERELLASPPVEGLEPFTNKRAHLMETAGVGGGFGGGMPAVGGFGGADAAGGFGAPAAATGGDSGAGSLRNMFQADSFTPCASGGG